MNKPISNSTSKSLAHTIGTNLTRFSKMAQVQYKPLVDDIILNKSRDENHIQRTLDGLLDFCYDEKILYYYRSLCKYYYGINPNITTEYIGYYREMYDERKS